MDDFLAQRSYWRRHGPPLNVAAQVIGRALGIEWKIDEGEPPAFEEIESGLSIAELAAIAVTL